MKGQRRLSQGELPHQKQSNSNKDEATPPLFKEEQTIVHTRRHLETTVRIWQKQFGFGFEIEDTLLDYQQAVCHQPKIKNILSTGLHVPLMKTQKKISDLPRPATKMAPALATMATASSNASDADLETRGCSKVSWKVHPNPRYVGCRNAICVNLPHDQPENTIIIIVVKAISACSMFYSTMMFWDTMPGTHKIHACFFAYPKLKWKVKENDDLKLKWSKISCFLPTRYTQKEHT